ncbi:hypothetical protein [Pedobacter terrae]|uniref:hypothetical protein n=1 Tax=Pedobacter terrae TaxID=405671 RepID=UPI002FFB0E66
MWNSICLAEALPFWLRLKPSYPIADLQQGARTHINWIQAEQNAFRFGFGSMDEK